MYKNFLFLFLLSPPLLLASVTIKFEEPCTKVIKVFSDEAINLNLMEFTNFAIENLGIISDTNETGVRSLFNTPQGLDAMEVLSDTEMNAFGWCYKLNGEIPDVYGSEIKLKPFDIIEWFYSYSYYKEGKWLTYCTPMAKGHPFICEKITK